MFYRTAAISALLVLCSCTARPVPDHSARLGTAAIARHVVCEAYRAMLQSIDETLREKGDAVTADRLKGDPGLLARLSYTGLPTQSAEFFRKFDDTDLAILFSLDVSEGNEAMFSLDIARIASGGLASLGGDTTTKLTRQNRRDFLIAYTARGLAEKFAKEQSCLRPQPNGLYPITGSLGFEEMFRTFILLARDGDLKRDGVQDNSLIDTITFTTDLTHSIGGAVGHGSHPAWRLKLFSGDVKLYQKDVHKLTVSLALNDDPPAAAPSSGPKAARAKSIRRPAKARTKAAIEGAGRSTNAAVRALNAKQVFDITDTLQTLTRSIR